MSATGSTRRGFLKGVGSAAALLALGCTPTREELVAHLTSLSPVNAPLPVVYPKLPDHKVQAPEKGSLVKFHKLGLPSPIREQRKKIAHDAISFDNLVATFDKNWKHDDLVFSEHVINDLNY